MKLAFKELVGEDLFAFDGEITKQELDYLLQYAIVDLMRKGAFAKQLQIIEVPDDEDSPIRH